MKANMKTSFYKFPWNPVIIICYEAQCVYLFGLSSLRDVEHCHPLSTDHDEGKYQEVTNLTHFFSVRLSKTPERSVINMLIFVSLVETEIQF